jgi:tRNA A37 threonylcarbamoyladenosine dehydratase
MKHHYGFFLTLTTLTAIATTLVVESVHKYYLKDGSTILLDYIRNLLPFSINSQCTPKTITASGKDNIKDVKNNGFIRTSENTVKHIPQPYSEDLILEQLTRNYSFLSYEGMKNIRSLKVIVVGAGGVGSNAIVSLVRSGVSHLRIIDFDQVSLSSLNRHACATLKDVGRSKVECLVDFVGKISPWSEVEGINELFSIEKAERLLLEMENSQKPDYIVDCIDNIDTKVDLLEFCYKNKIKVISSMGAACKSDATRINIGDISVSDEDPLARTVRRRLKKLGIANGITTIFSAEKPDPRKASLLPLPDEEFERGKVDELSALQNFRVRILPVLGTMPGMFGLAIATWIVTEAGGYPVEPIEGKNRYKVYDSLFQSLAGQQTRVGIKNQRTPWISLPDIQYILEEVWRGKSPVSGLATRLTLSRWLPNVELGTQNVVVLTKEEQKEHERRVLLGGEKPEDVYSPEVMKRVSDRFEEEKYYAKFR